MTVQLPTDVRALRREIARASLAHSFRQTFGGELPDYLIDSSQEITRAEREWRTHYAQQAILLARVAQQALACLNQQGLGAAIGGFTSSVVTQPELNSFMHANPYLEELVACTCNDEDLFRTLLTLLVDLGISGH
jgi:hypothetical protein